MRLPQDVADLLAVTIRDVIWYKDSVCAFLEECGVPADIMVGVRRSARTTPTVKIVKGVLDDLARKGDDGFRVARKLLTRMYYWNDLHSVAPDRLDAAVSSLKSLQEAYRRYNAQVKYQEEQEQQMHEQRVSRTALSGVDHARLQSFRDEFDRIHTIADPHRRGDRFQDLMNRIFAYYCEKSQGDFRRTGEQLDGAFYFDKHWYCVEIRWRKEKAKAGDVSVLRDRAKDAYGGDTKALFISFNGFTDECLARMSGLSDERVILMDGYDLRCVLDCQIAFDVLIAEKQAEMVRNKRPFVSAKEIIGRRSGSA